jgi:hypothetical protein
MMEEDELAELGRNIAYMGRHRPDIVYKILIEMRREFERQGMFPQLGDVLHALQRRAIHDLAGKQLPIPMKSLNAIPSGYGMFQS